MHALHTCPLPPPPLQAERERQKNERVSELRSMTARYRGPLLEATVDLEQRLYHMITGTSGSWL